MFAMRPSTTTAGCPMIYVDGRSTVWPGTSWWRSRAVSGRVTLIAVLAALLASLFGIPTTFGPAVAAGARDLTGTWVCCGSGGAAAQNFILASTVGGRAELPGGQVFASITGSLSGDAVTIVTTYNSFAPGYVAIFTGTVSADGTTMSGTWTSNRSQSGTWTATRVSQKSKIEGRIVVTACDGRRCAERGLAGARVTARGSEVGTAKTAADGRYSIEVEPGPFVVTPSLRGRTFAPKSRRVTVPKTGKATANFETCALDGDLGQSGASTHQLSTPLACPPTGIDWQMPERLSKQVRAWSAGSDSQPLPRRFVHPNQWRVRLFLTHKGQRLKACAPGTKWRWTITPPEGERVITRTPIVGCSPNVDVSGLGTYRVYAEDVNDDTRVPASGTARVVVEDLLIVGIGDSNGSGEGNPSFQVRRCARGTTSYQFQVADFIEQQDDHSSVTFVFTACSGASVTHLITTRYRGTVPNESAPLAPQLVQVGDLITDAPSATGRGRAREVDAALISIGVNDLSFGPVLETCVKFGQFGRALVEAGLSTGNCADERVRPRFDSRNGLYTFDYLGTTAPVTGTPLGSVISSFQRELPGRIRELGPALRRRPGLGDAGLGLRNLKRAFFTTYPDFSGNDAGAACDTFANAFSVPRWKPATWQWLRDQSLELNRNVALGASSIGATTVVIPSDIWARHGYCASNSWFVPVLSAVVEDDATGPFHPNVTGHTISAGYNARAVCRALRGRADCRGTGEPRAAGGLPLPK